MSNFWGLQNQGIHVPYKMVVSIFINSYRCFKVMYVTSIYYWHLLQIPENYKNRHHLLGTNCLPGLGAAHTLSYFILSTTWKLGIMASLLQIGKRLKQFKKGKFVSEVTDSPNSFKGNHVIKMSCLVYFKCILLYSDAQVKKKNSSLSLPKCLCY